MAGSSPFKFLDPYEQADAYRFFGREKETEDLYQMSFRTPLMLVYGPSGTGKTSIMKCGVANRFGPTSWLGIYILRKGDHILTALRREVDQLLRKVAYAEMAMPENLSSAIRQLYRLTSTPIYLILDQFEEVLIADDPGEAKAFFQFLAALLGQGGDLPCKVILIMREEFIASCWSYERILPQLFDYRYRIERMRPDSDAIRQVINGTLGHLEEIELREGVTEKIIERLTVGKAGLELTYLQVYLDRLYRQAQREADNGRLVFSPKLVATLGEIEDVIGDFLDEQLRELEGKLGPGREAIPLRLLSVFVTDDRTKKVVTEDELKELKAKYQLTDAEFELCMSTFYRMQIIREYED